MKSTKEKKQFEDFIKEIIQSEYEKRGYKDVHTFFTRFYEGNICVVYINSEDPYLDFEFFLLLNAVEDRTKELAKGFGYKLDEIDLRYNSVALNFIPKNQ